MSDTVHSYFVSAMGKDVDCLPMVKSVAIKYLGIRRDCVHFISDTGYW